MKRLLLCLGCVFSMALPVSAVAQRVMTVSGQAEIEVPAEVAHIGFGVEHQAPTAADAMRRVDEALMTTVAAWRAQGLPDVALRTSALSLSPVYGESRGMLAPPLVGYRAAVRLDATVAAERFSGALIDELISAGANRMDSLRFDVRAAEPLIHQVEADAMADALDRAARMAAAAGVTLGPIQSIEMQSRDAVPMMGLRAAGAMPIGQVSLSARVQISVRIR